MFRKSSYSFANGDCVEADTDWAKSSRSSLNGSCVEWAKSSRSHANGNCAEVRGDNGRVLLRDSKDKAGPVLAFTPAEWGAFLAAVKAGE